MDKIEEVLEKIKNKDSSVDLNHASKDFFANRKANKEELRRLIRGILKNLDKGYKRFLDTHIFEQIMSLDLSATNVCIYKSLPTEVDTDAIFDYFVSQANVYMPVVEGDDLKLVQVDNNTKFEVGPFNILEPVGERLDPSDVELDLCITPMLGGDQELNRLGKGKGYYDRFFDEVDCYKVGLCYNFALVDEIDCEKHDVKMDVIVTDMEIVE